jgi:hypothetical protein
VQKYGIVIKQKKQPLLVAFVRSGDSITKVYLVPELCNMVGLTSEQRKDFFLTRTIYEEVSKTPKGHSLELMKFVKSLSNPECEKVCIVRSIYAERIIKHGFRRQRKF